MNAAIAIIKWVNINLAKGNNRSMNYRRDRRLDDASLGLTQRLKKGLIYSENLE